MGDSIRHIREITKILNRVYGGSQEDLYKRTLSYSLGECTIMATSLHCKSYYGGRSGEIILSENLRTATSRYSSKLLSA